MRNDIFALLVAASMSAAVRPEAQTTTSIGIAAGATLPVSDYNQIANSGYHITLLFDAERSASPVSFRAEGGFIQLDMAQNASSGVEHTEIWNATANMVVNTSAMMAPRAVFHARNGPYFIAGLGWYRVPGESLANGFRVFNQNKVGVNAGVGYWIPLSGFRAFVEARYHSVLSSDAHVSFIPISVGVLF